MKKQTLIILLAFLIFEIGLVYSQSSFNVCCEKTNEGAWCQNNLEENCDVNFRVTPTNCKSTSFCKPGCCVDSDEGLCMENTPERVCEESTGTWVDDVECNIPQCDLGCCILGDQASFVTLTRCKKLSGFYGLETNFKKNIGDEASCILTAQLQDRGACVFEQEDQRTCEFTTREGCIRSAPGSNITSGGEFFKDYLCSADELAANCGPTTNTICIDGKDEVYFVDSCGNPANIYDANKIYSKNPAYWQKIVSKSETCGAGSDNGNAGSRSCGNCDYFKGSICSDGGASYGDYLCKDLNCYNTENGNDYRNGESWCMYQGTVGLGRDSVGSRHFRHICINGEELVEPCADFRNDICIQNQIETSNGVYRESACRVNRWKSCMDQDEERDCLNTDQRDCYWLGGFSFIGAAAGSVVSAEAITSSRTFEGGATGGFGGGVTGNIIGSVDAQEITAGVQAGGGGICLPEIPPGFAVGSQSDASSTCSLGNAVCAVKYERGALTGFDWEAEEPNKGCLELSWAAEMNNICTSLGDCGAYVNIAGKFTDYGAEWRVNEEKRVLTGLLNEVKKKARI